MFLFRRFIKKESIECAPCHATTSFPNRFFFKCVPLGYRRVYIGGPCSLLASVARRSWEGRLHLMAKRFIQ